MRPWPELAGHLRSSDGTELLHTDTEGVLRFVRVTEKGGQKEKRWIQSSFKPTTVIPDERRETSICPHEERA